MRQTHTYAVLDVSKRTYDDIRARLAKAGYEHAFHADSERGEVIDMYGIALSVEPTKKKSK